MAVIRKISHEMVHARFETILCHDIANNDDSRVRDSLSKYALLKGLFHSIVLEHQSQFVSIVTTPKYLTRRIELHSLEVVDEFFREINYAATITNSALVLDINKLLIFNGHLFFRATNDWPVINIFLDRFVDFERSSVLVHNEYVLAWKRGRFGCAKDTK